jgi:hypothetical protein
MIDLLITLLRILFPLDPVARLREITRDYINAIVSCLEDPARREQILNTPHLCAKLDADIAALEHGIHLLIHERARQILGLPYIYTPRIPSPEQRRARPLSQIIARLGRMAALFHNLERLAQRRATRMKRELEENPLRLDATHRSTSPALCAEEENHQRLSSSSASRWGRWIGASSRRDGGGSLRTRGPPERLKPNCRLSTPHCPGSLSFRGRTHLRQPQTQTGRPKAAR